MPNNENIIYGRNPVKEALRSDRVLEVYTNSAFHDEETIKLIKNKGIAIKIISNEELSIKSNRGVHQGIVAHIKRFEYSSLQNIIGKCKKKTKPVIVILDGIEDPHNFGAIIRSSEVFGVDAVIISKHNQVPLTASVAKSSAGAINYVPIVLVTNISQTIAELKKEGFWVVSSDGEAKTNYYDIKYDFPVVLIIGSEGKGVSKLVKQNSDYLVKIPMLGHINSLNASVAAGILLSKIRE